jgi:putative transposase
MQLQRVLNGYVAYFNRARPHQGIRQQIPELLGEPLASDHDYSNIISCSVLGGLHHNYTRGA